VEVYEMSQPETRKNESRNRGDDSEGSRNLRPQNSSRNLQGDEENPSQEDPLSWIEDVTDNPAYGSIGISGMGMLKKPSERSAERSTGTPEEMEQDILEESQD
jgi:hypothetical protein